MKEEIYKIIDSFLVEAKDQNGKERSLEQLNRDRHLAAEAFEKLLIEEYRRGYNQRLKDEGKTGERWQHLYL